MTSGQYFARDNRKLLVNRHFVSIEACIASFDAARIAVFPDNCLHAAGAGGNSASKRTSNSTSQMQPPT
jgi:hypothetical protein